MAPIASIVEFKSQHNLADRQKISNTIKAKYPDRIPVIVTQASKNDPTIDKTKFLCPSEITMGKFIHEVRKHVAIASTEALFLFCVTGSSGSNGGGTVLPPSTALISSLYDKHADEDGFIYFVYSKENTFG